MKAAVAGKHQLIIPLVGSLVTAIILIAMIVLLSLPICKASTDFTNGTFDAPPRHMLPTSNKPPQPYQISDDVREWRNKHRGRDEKIDPKVIEKIRQVVRRHLPLLIGMDLFDTKIRQVVNRIFGLETPLQKAIFYRIANDEIRKSVRSREQAAVPGNAENPPNTTTPAPSATTPSPNKPDTSEPSDTSDPSDNKLVMPETHLPDSWTNPETYDRLDGVNMSDAGKQAFGRPKSLSLQELVWIGAFIGLGVIILSIVAIACLEGRTASCNLMTVAIFRRLTNQSTAPDQAQHGPLAGFFQDGGPPPPYPEEVQMSNLSDPFQSGMRPIVRVALGGVEINPRPKTSIKVRVEAKPKVNKEETPITVEAKPKVNKEETPITETPITEMFIMDGASAKQDGESEEEKFFDLASIKTETSTLEQGRQSGEDEEDSGEQEKEGVAKSKVGSGTAVKKKRKKKKRREEEGEGNMAEEGFNVFHPLAKMSPLANISSLFGPTAEIKPRRLKSKK